MTADTQQNVTGRTAEVGPLSVASFTYNALKIHLQHCAPQQGSGMPDSSVPSVAGGCCVPPG